MTAPAGQAPAPSSTGRPAVNRVEGPPRQHRPADVIDGAGCDRGRSKHQFTAEADAIAAIEAAALTHPRAVAPAFVVASFTFDGRIHRRQIYLSLHSALKAKDRAEKAGRRFELQLCELVPTPYKPLIVVGGEDR